jgi:hypothetical protein
MLPGPTLSISRFATDAHETGVPIVTLLFAASGSFSAPATEALFWTVPVQEMESGTSKAMVKARTEPDPRFPTAHETLEPLWLHAPLLKPALKRRPEVTGVSVSTTLEAFAGPLFSAVTV